MNDKDIQCQVVKVIQDQPSRGGTNQLRIVRWIVDGKDTGALLEKRNLFISPDGMEKMGKAKGLNKKEMQYIVEHWNELEPLM